MRAAPWTLCAARVLCPSEGRDRPRLIRLEIPVPCENEAMGCLAGARLAGDRALALLVRLAAMGGRGSRRNACAPRVLPFLGWVGVAAIYRERPVQWGAWQW